MPVENSLWMFHGLREVDLPAELPIFEGLSHEFDGHPEFDGDCAALCDLFLERHMGLPAISAGNGCSNVTSVYESRREKC